MLHFGYGEIGPAMGVSILTGVSSWQSTQKGGRKRPVGNNSGRRAMAQEMGNVAQRKRGEAEQGGDVQGVQQPRTGADGITNWICMTTTPLW